MGLYGYILNTVNTVSLEFINSNIQKVATYIKAPAYTFLSIYILFIGWKAISGNLKEPVLDLAIKLLKSCFILGLAIELSSYNIYVTDVFLKGPEDFATSLIASGSQADVLDRFFGETWDIGTKFWEKGGFSVKGIGFVFAAFFIYIAAISLSAYSCFLIVLSKMALAIIIALGPLFIMCLLFESTKKFFELWIGQLVNYGFIYLFVISINSLLLIIFNHFLTSAQSNLSGGEVLAAAAPLLITAFLGVLILSQIPSIASSLGGGLALSTFSVGSSATKLSGKAAGKGTLATGKAAGSLSKKVGRKVVSRFRK